MKTYEEFRKKMNDLLDKITLDWEKGKVEHAEGLFDKMNKLAEKYPEWDIKYDEEISDECDEKYRKSFKHLEKV